MFQNLQKKLQATLGLQLRLDSKEWREFRSLLGKEKERVQITHLGWVADFPDPHSFMSIFTSQSESNYTGWKNTKYEKIVEEAVATQDENRRLQLYNEAQKILLVDEAVIMPLFYSSHQALVKSDLKGVTLNALDRWYFKRIKR